MAVDVSVEAFPGPDEIDGFWAFDKMHAPRPITTLSEDLVTLTLAEGFTTAQAMYDSPVMMTNQHVNYYLYASFHPIGDEKELGERLARYRDTLADKVPGVGRRWEEEWKPAIIDLNMAEKEADYSELDDEALLAKLAEMKQRMTFMWHVHGHINFVLISSAKFCDRYDEIVQPDDPTEAYQCLQGWETQSMKASRGLWRLSRLIRREPELVGLFESTTPQDLPEALAASDAGRTFLAELDAYLDDFGWRSDAVYDLGDITWREDPSIPLGALISYVALDDSADPDILFEKAVATRDGCWPGAEKLAGDPERLAEFDELYEAARYSNPLTEDHAFWIDQMSIALFRRFVLHIGERLADRGLIGEAGDVNFLTEDELIDAVRNGTDRRESHRAATRGARRLGHRRPAAHPGHAPGAHRGPVHGRHHRATARHHPARRERAGPRRAEGRGRLARRRHRHREGGPQPRRGERPRGRRHHGLRDDAAAVGAAVLHRGRRRHRHRRRAQPLRHRGPRVRPARRRRHPGRHLHAPDRYDRHHRRHQGHRHHRRPPLTALWPKFLRVEHPRGAEPAAISVRAATPGVRNRGGGAGRPTRHPRDGAT